MTSTHSTKTITVELPVVDIPGSIKQIFAGGFPFNDPESQQWKLGATPIGDNEHLLVIHQERMGVYRVAGQGARFQQIVNYEPGGGGAFTLPFELVRDEKGVVTDIEIAFLEEERPLIMSDGSTASTVLGVAGGFQNPGDTGEETAKQEHAEELRVDTPEIIGEVSAHRSVANRAFDVALDVMDGMKVFAYEMGDDKRAELVSKGNQVMSWTEARRSRDMLVKGAVFELITWVSENYKTAL